MLLKFKEVASPVCELAWNYPFAESVISSETIEP